MHSPYEDHMHNRCIKPAYYLTLHQFAMCRQPRLTLPVSSLYRRLVVEPYRHCHVLLRLRDAHDKHSKVLSVSRAMRRAPQHPRRVARRIHTAFTRCLHTHPMAMSAPNGKGRAAELHGPPIHHARTQVPTDSPKASTTDCTR